MSSKLLYDRLKSKDAALFFVMINDMLQLPFAKRSIYLRRQRVGL